MFRLIDLLTVTIGIGIALSGLIPVGITLVVENQFIDANRNSFQDEQLLAHWKSWGYSLQFFCFIAVGTVVYLIGLIRFFNHWTSKNDVPTTKMIEPTN